MPPSKMEVTVNNNGIDGDGGKGLAGDGPSLMMLSIVVVVTAVVFFIDIFLPLGIAAGVLYLALIVTGIWFPKPSHVYLLAVLASVMTSIGLLLSPSESAFWIVLVNRGLALFAIWLMAFLIVSRKNLENALRRAGDGLELEVVERTKNLHDSEERFRDFAETSSDWFWNMDDNLRFTNIFRGYRSSFDADPEIYVGKTRLDSTCEDTGNEKWRLHLLDLENHRPFKNFVYDLKTDDGSRVTVLTNGRPVFDKNGVFCGYRGTGSDITERRILEEKLQHTQRMEAIGQLTGGIAHDFNNLLNVMLGNAELLKSKFTDNTKAQHHIDSIIRTVDRGASLTNRLLSFSRQQALSPKPTAINDLVTGLADMLQRTLGETVELHVLLESQQSIAMFDPHELENALVNLAINARDAMPEGGELTIETSNASLDATYARQHEEVTPGEYVMIAVSDTGSGMTADVLAKAYEPFFTTKDVGKGSGLGLSMVYGFVKQSGGHITIYSELDHGTTIKLYLPYAADAIPEKINKEVAPEFAPGTERILVVEDEEKVREISVNILRAQGYRIAEATDGKEAIEILKSGQSFDLLFTDVVLPGGINGVKIAQEAKRLQPAIKVLYTTGYTENVIVQNGTLDPDVTLVNKPFRRHELLGKVQKILSSKD